MIMRRIRLAIAVGSAAAVALGVLVVGVPATTAAGGHPPGVVGNKITLQSDIDLVSYDVAANSAGRAYIGWITNDNASRSVHLCTLPVSATACQGGVQTLPGLDVSSAGLRVLVTDNDDVKLVWFHNTGLTTAVIAVATAPQGQGLALTSDTTSAPPNGSLLTAEIAPSGEIWTVTYEELLPHRVLVRPGLGADQEIVSTPFAVGHAQLAFTGGKAVLAFEQNGFSTTTARYKVRPAGGSFGAVQAVAHTWTIDAGAALETTPHGLRIVTNVDDASYRPVIAKWTGTGFSPRQLTPDKDACGAHSHDGWTDASGRLLDVSWECRNVTVANYADAAHAAIVRFDSNGVPTYTPQIASGTRGVATVVWSVEGSGLLLHKLRFAHVRLPDSTVTVSHSGPGGTVSVTGPRSCLPPVNVPVGWTHKPANNWSFRAGSLRLGSQGFTSSTLDGATLDPGKQYNLIGTAIFGRGADRSTVRATLTFRTCGTG
jgi:hypothetical protein